MKYGSFQQIFCEFFVRRLFGLEFPRSFLPTFVICLDFSDLLENTFGPMFILLAIMAIMKESCIIVQ